MLNGSLGAPVLFLRNPIPSSENLVYGEYRCLVCAVLEREGFQKWHKSMKNMTKDFAVYIFFVALSIKPQVQLGFPQVN
jgi:hypothetical protein